jgi:hypothetical protein
METIPTVLTPRRLNMLLAWACLLLAGVLPVAALAGLWSASSESLLAQVGVALPAAAGLPVDWWQWAAVVTVSMLPICGMAYGLLRARRCFLGFLDGAVFSLGTVRHLRGFAAGLLASSLAGLMAPTLLGLLLTWQAPAGGRALLVALGAQHLLMLLFAGIVWQIAHVMTRACEISDDNAQFV